MHLARLGLIVFLLGLTACPPTVRDCAQGTLFVNVTLGAGAEKADHLVVQISIDAGFPVTQTLDLTTGTLKGGVEIRFPSGYPQGKTAHVTMIALDGAATVGMAAVDVALTGACGSASLTIGSTMPDLRLDDAASMLDLTTPTGTDLSATPDDLSGVVLDLTPSQADLVTNPSVDLSSRDLTPVCAATEDCFNGIDDDCDSMPDCADPDCNAIAMCVPPPTGTFKLGTLLATQGSCSTIYPDALLLSSGPVAGTCNKGSCGCVSGTDSGGFCRSALMNAGSDNMCGGGSSPVNVDGPNCLSVTPPANGNYHWGQSTYIAGLTCGTNGFPSSGGPTFSKTQTFCSRTDTSGGAGCTGGQICVPKVATQCVIAPGSASCPSGYQAQSTSFFTGMSTNFGCSCVCLMTGGVCPLPQIFNTATCAGGGYSAGCSNENLTTTAVSIKGVNPTSAATCGGAYAQQSGDANGTPTGPQTVCCLP